MNKCIFLRSHHAHGDVRCCVGGSAAEISRNCKEGRQPAGAGFLPSSRSSRFPCSRRRRSLALKMRFAWCSAYTLPSMQAPHRRGRQNCACTILSDAPSKSGAVSLRSPSIQANRAKPKAFAPLERESGVGKEDGESPRGVRNLRSWFPTLLEY